MDFLKKNPYPLAAYCFAGYSVLRLFNTSGVVGILGLLGYIFLAVMLFMKRRDIMLVAAAAVPSVVTLLNMIIGLFGGGSLTLLGFLGFVVGLLMPAYVAAFLLPQAEPYVGKYMDYLRKFWYVPAAAQGVMWFLNMGNTFTGLASWGGLEYFFEIYNIFSLLMTLLSIGGCLLLCNWMVFPEGLPEEWFDTSAQSGEAVSGQLAMNIVAHILLLFFTCGIWLFVWIYRATKALNNVPGENNRNPVAQLLLCFFIPFYFVYWVYKTSQRIDKLAAMKGVSSDISTICLILAIFVSIVPPIVMQAKMNDIAAAGSGDYTYGSATYDEPAYPVPTYDAFSDSGSGYSDDGKEKAGNADPIPLEAPPQVPQLAEPAAPAEPAGQAAADDNNDLDDSKSMKKYI